MTAEMTAEMTVLFDMLLERGWVRENRRLWGRNITEYILRDAKGAIVAPIVDSEHATVDSLRWLLAQHKDLAEVIRPLLAHRVAQERLNGRW